MIRRPSRGLVLAMFALALSCAEKRAKLTESSAQAATPPAPSQAAAATPAPVTAPVADTADDRRGRDRARPKLRITLRSTPPGATASVDGTPLGPTPMLHEMEADNRMHEFTFVLDGYAPERYRFPPVQDGVVHAQLRPLSGPLDAGPP